MACLVPERNTLETQSKTTITPRAPPTAPKRTHQLQPNGLPDDHVHDQSLHLERIKELAKFEKEEADREVVKYQSALERQRKAEQILALLGL
jgi:hypothetical protein